MNRTPNRKMSANTTAALLLGFVVLGFFGEFAHQNDHSLADPAERCATCVHLDQPAQPGTAPALVLPASPPRAVVLADDADPAAGQRPSLYESRAPPA